MKLSTVFKAVFVGVALFAMLEDTFLYAPISGNIQLDVPDYAVFYAIENCGSGTASELIPLFKNGGVDINVIDKATGNTPLIAAVKRGCKNIISFLLINGANPDARDKAGKTALQWAVAKKDIDMIRTLLRHGARDVGMSRTLQRYVGRSTGLSKVYSDDFTDLLTFAVESDNEPIVLELLAAGADPKAKDSKGRTAESLAKTDKMKKTLNDDGFLEIEKNNVDSNRPPEKPLDESWINIPGW
jgi:ankyrin repeat protein